MDNFLESTQIFILKSYRHHFSALLQRKNGVDDDDGDSEK